MNNPPPTPRPLRSVPTPATTPDASPAIGERSIDQALVARVLRGHHDGRVAEELLYVKYRYAVSRAATFRGLDADEAEDVVQDTFVRAFLALPSLKDSDRFSAWLLTIARNRASSYLSARGSHQKAAEDANREALLSPDVEADAPAQIGHQADLAAVRSVIEGLREGPEKETVRLFYLEGDLSAREIADKMGVGKSAVTMRLERFRARVRDQLLALCG